MTATLVIGFGVTGRAVTASLRAAGESVIVADDRPDAAMRDAVAAAGARLVDASDPGALAGVGQVVPSPGVPVGHPLLEAALLGGVAVRSEIELASELLGQLPAPRAQLVAITGTNGKTTVTDMVAGLLTASGRRAVTGGNIGTPLIDAVTAEADVVVAEVSSFQLQFTERWHPSVSCWLNLADDHLDWHPSLEHYGAAKARIWANQGHGDTAVVNAADPIVNAAAARIPAGVRVVRFGAPGAHFVDDSPASAADDPSRCRLTGPGGDVLRGRVMQRALPHDRANALAAAAVAFAAGATADGVADGLAAWRPLAHRVELVGEVGGIRFYDDSKATTPASVLAAVAGFRSVVLIAGGRNKGLDLTSLGRTVPPVHAVVAIGEAAGEVEAAFAGTVPVHHAADMRSAVATAWRSARRDDAVLLSPGCASFDRYRSYAARGDDFTAAVRALAASANAPEELR